MRRARLAHRAALLPVLAFPARASAQTVGGDASTVMPSAADWGAAALAVVLVVTLLVIVVGVKLYDAKRKREGDALTVQARISDALLRDFVTLPITAVVSGSAWRRSPLILTIRGSVPTPELREAVMRLVGQELSRHHSGVTGRGSAHGRPAGREGASRDPVEVTTGHRAGFDGARRRMMRPFRLRTGPSDEPPAHASARCGPRPAHTRSPVSRRHERAAGASRPGPRIECDRRAGSSCPSSTGRRRP